MYDFSRRTTVCRALLLWSAVTATTAGLAALTVPLLAAAPGPVFTGLLVRACAALALAAGCGLWVLTTEVALTVVAGRRPAGPSRGVLGPVRALLLAACGVAALAAPAAAAGDDQHGPTGTQPLDGLPLPDRAASAPDPPGTRPPDDTDTVRVRPGDCLWTIAEQRLGPRAGVVEVAAYWQRVHALNRDVIGPDPDVIHPGQRLQLPSTT